MCSSNGNSNYYGVKDMKTISYMGSKKVLLPFIEDSIKEYLFPMKKHRS
jgi:hypothetical protein